MVAPQPIEKLATSKYVLLTTIKLLSEAFFDIMNNVENITAQTLGKSSHSQYIFEIDFLKNEHWHADAPSYVFD